jgi:DNA-binding response OmpR family regulator
MAAFAANAIATPGAGPGLRFGLDPCVERHPTIPAMNAESEANDDVVSTSARFGADRAAVVRGIGHAARTPSSVVQALLESVLEHQDLAGELRGHVGRALGSAVELHEQLEQLIEVGSWTDELAATSTRFDGLVTDVVGEVHADIIDRQVEFSASIEAPIDIVAPADRARWITRRMLLLANRQTQRGGRIELTVRREGSRQAVLTVRTTPRRADVDIEQELRAVDRVLVGCNGSLELEWLDARCDLIAVFPTVVPNDQPEADTGRRRRTSSRGRRQHDEIDLDAGPVDEVIGPLGAREVLVVEDDEHLRSVLRQALATDYRVHATASAHAALSMVRDISPDVVVCDLVLPGIGGEALIRSFRAEPRLASAAIIVVSGRTDDAIRTRLLQDGADDYLAKPFHIDELRTRIDKLLASVDTIARLRDDLTSADRLSHQLEHALDSRVLIEQAKGFLAARHAIEPNAAFDAMRAYARHHRRPIRDVAALVLDGDIDIHT